MCNNINLKEFPHLLPIRNPTTKLSHHPLQRNLLLVLHHSETHLNYLIIRIFFAASLSDAVVTRKTPYFWAFLIFRENQEAAKPIRYLEMTKEKLIRELFWARRNRGEDMRIEDSVWVGVTSFITITLSSFTKIKTQLSRNSLEINWDAELKHSQGW